MLRIEGKDPLPDDDINEIFKPTPAPSRYETLLLTKQINDHCQNVCLAHGLGRLQCRSIGILGGPDPRPHELKNCGTVNGLVTLGVPRVLRAAYLNSACLPATADIHCIHTSFFGVDALPCQC